MANFGNNEYMQLARKQFATHFDCEMEESDKRKFTPWLEERSLERELGSKLKTIRTTSNTTFRIEVNNSEQSNAMQTITNINGIQTKISVNTILQTTEGLIYVYGYNMVDFKTLREGLMNQFGLQDVIEASWIKSRGNGNAKPLLLHFRNEIPQYIDVPGEMMPSKVYEYK